MKTESNAWLDAFTQFIRTMDESSSGRLEEVYDEAIQFSDPINEARGLVQLKAVYRDLFKQLESIEFRILDSTTGTPTSFIHWEMTYHFRGKPRKLPGITTVQFSKSGKALLQKDFWDASEGVFREFPLMGLVQKGIRKLVRVKYH